MRVWYVLRRRKIVFRSGNNEFRTATGRLNLTFEGRHRAKTTEFGLRSLGRTGSERRVCPASAGVSGSNRLFLAFEFRGPGERSSSFIRVCPPRYGDARTGIAGHRRRSRRSPSRTVSGPARRDGSRVRPSTPPTTHERPQTRLEAHGIVDSRRSLSKLRDTRHTAVRSRLRRQRRRRPRLPLLYDLPRDAVRRPPPRRLTPAVPVPNDDAATSFCRHSIDDSSFNRPLRDRDDRFAASILPLPSRVSPSRRAVTRRRPAQSRRCTRSLPRFSNRASSLLRPAFHVTCKS